MKRGIKLRLVAFLILSAVGIVYITANYLGLIDRITGNQLTLQADLPTSGGLFVGSEVTYRGVKIGKVSRMTVTPDGVRVTLTVAKDTEIPVGSPFYVHNLSAVGEQYLDFEPKDHDGPYAQDGEVFAGTEASLPQSTDDLLVKIDGLVGSLDPADAGTLVSELGTTFRGAAGPLRTMIDQGSKLVAAAREAQTPTLDLLRSGQTVLSTQQRNAANIRSISANLAVVSQVLRNADPDLRTLLRQGPPAVRELNGLLTGLEPTLPSFLGNLVTVNQVATDRLNAVEQTLVTFVPVIASGFTGTPGDGFGHINLQFNYQVPPCTKGYRPPSTWRPGTDTSPRAPFPARCLSGPPYAMRGTKYAPAPSSVTGSADRVGPYDGGQPGAVVAPGGGTGRHTVFGDGSWQLMLLGYPR